MKKGIGQIKHPFKNSHQTRNSREFLNPVKDTYENPTASIIHLMEKKSEYNSPQIRNKAKMSLPIASIQHYTRGLSWCNIVRRKIKVCRTERKKEASLCCRQYGWLPL